MYIEIILAVNICDYLFTYFLKHVLVNAEIYLHNENVIKTEELVQFLLVLCINNILIINLPTSCT